MKSNPCRLCQLKDQDKNNQICMHCVKRLDYVSFIERELSFGMTNAETKTPATPGFPMRSKRSYLFSVISERY
jgi:hypothetical protein